jgi:Zn-dependent M28 family amino/carboxypeptidase
LLTLVTVLVAGASSRPQAPAAPRPADGALAAALSTVDARAVRAHVAFLADDLLEGRATGTRGYDLAARYVAAQLAAVGLEPAGDGGTYFHQVPLLESRLDEGTLTVRGPAEAAQAFEWREDFVMRGDPRRTDARVEAPAIFAGYGVSAPDLSHDDYAGLEVKGRIVVLLSNAPSRFPSEQRAHHASFLRKAQLAAGKGAAGVVIVRTLEDEKIVPWTRLIANLDVASVSWLDREGNPADAPAWLQGGALLSAAGSKKLFARSPTPLDAVLTEAVKGAPRGFDLGTTLTLTARSTHRRFSSPNVVGRLPGADPALGTTSVVYSAHLDHVGLGAEVAGDRIYNGAYDNALGTASLLEAARALARLPRPARSIVFAFVTAEEKGLVGSAYFATHPPPAAGQPIANLNLDMPLLLFPIDKVVAFGGEHSTLGETVRRAVAMAGLTLIPDPMPEQTLFVRSDQYSFVRRGVPAVFLVPAFVSSDPKIDGGAKFRDFLARHYHQPSDDVSLPMDPDAVERFTRANVAAGYLVATSPETPRWLADSFFGRTFGRGR